MYACRRVLFIQQWIGLTGQQKDAMTSPVPPRGPLLSQNGRERQAETAPGTLIYNLIPARSD